MFTRLENGAEVEMNVATRWELGAETEAEGVYAVKNGAEEETWSSGIEPVGVYIYSETYNSLEVDGTEITMTALYSNRFGQWARLIVEIPDGATDLTISIDELSVIGETRAEDSTSKVTLTLYGSDNIITGTFDSNDVYETVGTVYKDLATVSKTVTNYEQSFTVSNRYLYLQFKFTKGSEFDTELQGEPLTLKISNFKLDGKRIKGNMTGIVVPNEDA